MLVIQGKDANRYPDIFDQVLKLRHDVFVDEMGWKDLASPDGKETDQFDTDEAVHLIAVREGSVAGYIRALPTNRPHLLSDVLPHLCEEASSPAGNEIWEMSRYCVHRQHRKGRALGAVGTDILAGMVEWANQAGVRKLVFEFEPMWILRAMQLNFIVRQLGMIHRIDGRDVIAAELTIMPSTMEALNEARQSTASLLQAA